MLTGSRRIPLLRLLALLALTGCVPPPPPGVSRLPAPPTRIAPPTTSANLVANGGFEQVQGDDPVGWAISGRERPGARLRSVETLDAPEGKRVAEIFLDPAGHPKLDYGLFFLQDVRVEPYTTYDLSIWVRGVDLVSGVNPPLGFGMQCGLFFWVLGPDSDPASRILPSGASPRRDGTTPWELRRMRFTTPPLDAFPAAKKTGDGRLHLPLQVLLFGTGTIQVDDLRVAPAASGPPPPRRGPGRLSLARRDGKPYFSLGIYTLPDGIDWDDLARMKVFNFTSGAQDLEAKHRLGLSSMVIPWLTDPACRGCAAPEAPECAYCRLCPDDGQRCGAYGSGYLTAPGTFVIWVDEPNAFPEIQGDLEDLIHSARRMHAEAARLKRSPPELYVYASDMPGGLYFNSYGWDDLALYHASDAFDIVGVLRRGGNPKKGAVGGVMSEYRQTSINGIRNDTRRIADDVTDGEGRQGKPVWMLVNGGSGRIIADRNDPAYATSPHNPAELLASRPSLAQLRYMLHTAVLNGATGLIFYQGSDDLQLTPVDPYWARVMFPAAAELATLERDTGFLTEPEVNPLPYHLTGDVGMVDSMLKRRGDQYLLAVANSSPDGVTKSEFVLEGGMRIEGPVERLIYRHDARPERRRFLVAPLRLGPADRFPLDLPGYGVALYRFKISGTPGSKVEPAETPPARR